MDKENKLDYRLSIESSVYHITMCTHGYITEHIPLHRHSHRSYEIHYISKGKGVLTADGRTYPLEPGSLFLTGPNVGHGQIHESLRFRPDVVNLEGMDIRDGEGIRKIIPPASVQFCSVDVSFISIKKILDALPPLLEREAWAVLLIKPQFEAGRAAVGKRGVVRDPAAHRAVLRELLPFLRSRGFGLEKLTPSPIKGGDGNIEYLALTRYGCPEGAPPDVEAVVTEAFGRRDE